MEVLEYNQSATENKNRHGVVAPTGEQEQDSLGDSKCVCCGVLLSSEQPEQDHTPPLPNLPAIVYKSFDEQQNNDGRQADQSEGKTDVNIGVEMEAVAKKKRHGLIRSKSFVIRKLTPEEKSHRHIPTTMQVAEKSAENIDDPLPPNSSSLSRDARDKIQKIQKWLESQLDLEMYLQSQYSERRSKELEERIVRLENEYTLYCPDIHSRILQDIDDTTVKPDILHEQDVVNSKCGRLNSVSTHCVSMKNNNYRTTTESISPMLSANSKSVVVTPSPAERQKNKISCSMDNPHPNEQRLVEIERSHTHLKIDINNVLPKLDSLLDLHHKQENRFDKLETQASAFANNLETCHAGFKQMFHSMNLIDKACMATNDECKTLNEKITEIQISMQGSKVKLDALLSRERCHVTTMHGFEERIGGLEDSLGKIQDQLHLLLFKMDKIQVIHKSENHRGHRNYFPPSRYFTDIMTDDLKLRNVVSNPITGNSPQPTTINHVGKNNNILMADILNCLNGNNNSRQYEDNQMLVNDLSRSALDSFQHTVGIYENKDNLCNGKHYDISNDVVVSKKSVANKSETEGGQDENEQLHRLQSECDQLYEKKRELEGRMSRCPIRNSGQHDRLGNELDSVEKQLSKNKLKIRRFTKNK